MNFEAYFLTLIFLRMGLTLPLQKIKGDAGEYIVVEDMHLPVRSQGLQQRGILLNRVWPNKTIPFVISPVFTDAERSVILNGLAEFEKYSCVRFVPRGEEKTYVNIFSGKGCWSVIGYNRGSDGLSLSLQSNACVWHRSVVHEAMHALGFRHEHRRKDRDYNVIVFLDNADSNQNNLQKDDGGVSLGIPYNVESVMHYGGNAFISARPHHPIDDTKIAWSDFRKVNRLYGCPPSYEAALDRLEFDSSTD